MKMSKRMLQTAYNDFCDAGLTASLQILINSSDKLTAEQSAIADERSCSGQKRIAPTDEMFDATVKALNN